MKTHRLILILLLCLLGRAGAQNVINVEVRVQPERYQDGFEFRDAGGTAIGGISSAMELVIWDGDFYARSTVSLDVDALASAMDTGNSETTAIPPGAAAGGVLDLRPLGWTPPANNGTYYHSRSFLIEQARMWSALSVRYVSNGNPTTAGLYFSTLSVLVHENGADTTDTTSYAVANAAIEGFDPFWVIDQTPTPPERAPDFVQNLIGVG